MEHCKGTTTIKHLTNTLTLQNHLEKIKMTKHGLQDQNVSLVFETI